MKLIEIFKPGTFVGMDGKPYAFTEADLMATAAAYDPQVHEAPMVVGHPRDNDPAYGWIKGLFFADGSLQAEPEQVDPQFAELHRSGRFKKRSASFYAPDDPRNPKPGVYYLRHLGFLGAQPPAVKGLKAANFADGATPLTVEFGDWNDRIIARVLRSLKNFLVEKHGQDEAEKVLSERDLESITEEALQPAVPAAGLEINPGFTEPATKEDAMTPEELKKKSVELDQREQKLAQDERQAAHGRNLAFAEQLVKDAKLLPRHKEFVADMLTTLGGSQGEINFAEGKKMAPLDGFKQFLEDLGSHPLFKQMVAPTDEKKPGEVNFSEPLTGKV